jgi:hypothetical protein
MFDADLNVWLIEVNTNPCLEESSKLLETLLPRMIDDMFKLTIDKIFPPFQPVAKEAKSANSNLISTVLKQRNSSTLPKDKLGSPYKVPGYNSQNMW